MGQLRPSFAPPARALAPALLADRYELISELARGGCGAVMEARDTVDERIVAIKVLKPGTFDAASSARFAREARVAAAIRHPNVCAVSDFGTLADGSPFLVMERLHGETLRAHVARNGRLDVEETIELAVQVLSGLEAAHALGIVHRDVKPENIFVTRPRRGLPVVKILDFGMCRGASLPGRAQEGSATDGIRLDRTLTRVGTVVGTPEYMAPEQASGGRAFDLRIDLHAVGVILFETLTGTRAFYGADPRAVLLAVIGKRPPSVCAIRPELPAVLDRIVTRAIERDPSRRYQSAAEFQHDLLEARTALRRERLLRTEAEQRQRSHTRLSDALDATDGLDETTMERPALGRLG